jgi:iron complex outermembrane receptor protein
MHRSRAALVAPLLCAVASTQAAAAPPAPAPPEQPARERGAPDARAAEPRAPDRRSRDRRSEPVIIVTGQRPEPIEQAPSTQESIGADRIAETVNVVNAEDALRYMPSLLVRKRHVGDTQAPLATRTSGVGASARSLIYVDGVLLSALIGNNNSSASPRWGMVVPDEIERIDILYGPFSAAYPGNSIGAVVNIATRLPDGPEGSITASTEVQSFDQYRTRGVYPARRLAATAGDRFGGLAWLVSANHVDSRSQPLAYVTVAQPAATGGAGTPAAGAVPDRNRLGAPIFVIGAGGFEAQRQDNLKLKLALDLSPDLRLVYRGGLFLNDTDSEARTWLTAGGAPAYSGALNIEGRPVAVPASAFSNNVYRLDERHWMHALTAEDQAGAFQWQAVATLYDFGRDVQRIPTGALPAASAGGPGAIVRLDGTGWRTLDLKGRLHRDGSAHDLGFGLHFDRFTLASNRYAAADWLGGPAGALTQSARGRTRTAAVWLQDGWTPSPALELTLGARYEWWRAYDGLNFSLAPPLSVAQPARARAALSPKATLRWLPGDGWSLTASAGQAWRFPTVSELYQAVSTGPTLTVPDPNLAPERARSAELSLERSWSAGRARLSLFEERIRGALISQSAPLVPGSTALFNFVQNVDSVRTRGAELVFEARDLPVPGLDLSASLTLADPEILRDRAFPAAEGKDLPQIPRRRATMVLTWRPDDATALTLAARYASRSFGTIDNSDPVTHTFQGFESYLVLDARARFALARNWSLALGVENIANRKYYLFHPFPQRSFLAEVGYRW